VSRRVCTTGLNNNCAVFEIAILYVLKYSEQLMLEKYNKIVFAKRYLDEKTMS
jgi:hypothetical protein